MLPLDRFSAFQKVSILLSDPKLGLQEKLLEKTKNKRENRVSFEKNEENELILLPGNDVRICTSPDQWYLLRDGCSFLSKRFREGGKGRSK